MVSIILSLTGPLILSHLPSLSIVLLDCAHLRPVLVRSLALLEISIGLV